MFDESKNLIGFSKIVRDMTDRKSAEEKLKRLNEQLKEMSRETQRSERHLHLITDKLPVAVVYVDASERFRFVNSTYASWRGLHKEKIIGMGIKDFFDPSTYKSLQPIIEDILNGRRSSYELTIQYADKSRYVSLNFHPDLDASGNIVGFVSVNTDVTEQKMAENFLRQAEIDAEHASQSKIAFLANMSHEIRTPLGAVMGFSELLLNPNLSSVERAKYASVIKRNGRLLADIFDDILDISKVEAGKLEIEIGKVSLSEVLKDVEAALSFQSTAKGISLSIVLDPAVPEFIITDALRLKQVLLSVVGNAIKFTNQGSVSVQVRLQQVSKRKTLIFEVIDTGSGIDQTSMGRLFERFSQEDVSTKRKYGGLGLGLILSKRLARLLGGDVTLKESVLGHGTTFIITIDPGEANSIAVLSENGPKTDGIAMTFAEPRIDGIKILLAEDCEDNQYLLKKILELAGAEVDVAENGKLAVERARAKHYDILLVDLQMPVMDGYEATAALRKEGFKTPIIALTAHSFQEERQRCLSGGFNEHLCKPVNRSALIESIQRFCTRVYVAEVAT